MHPYISSQLAADRQTRLLAEARQEHLARQARSARRAIRIRRLRPGRPLRLAAWLRGRVPARQHGHLPNAS
jgi:hypothetical protein